MDINDFVPPIVNVSFVVSIIFFFFSLTQLIQKKKLPADYFLSLFYFAVAIQNLSFWLYCRDSPVFLRYFTYSDSAFLFLIGPSLYLFVTYMTGHTRISPRIIGFHMAPCIITLTLIIVVNMLIPEPQNKNGHPLFVVLIALSYLSLFLYLIFIYRTLGRHYGDNRTRETRHLLICLQGSILFSFILITSVIWKELLLIGNIAFIAISLYFIFFLIRYPGFFQHIRNELQEMKYANSQLRGLDKDQLLKRLENLMAGKRIYRRSTLTLKELSHELGVSSPQLSELLNSHYNSNFNNFINSYRIEEVKAILEAEPEANILQTAIDCGFNSKTTSTGSF